MSFGGSASALKSVKERTKDDEEEHKQEDLSPIVRSASTSGVELQGLDRRQLEHVEDHDNADSLSCSTIDRFLEQQGFAVDDISSVSDDLSDKISTLRQQLDLPQTNTSSPTRPGAVVSGATAIEAAHKASSSSSLLSINSKDRKQAVEDAESIDRSMLLGESDPPGGAGLQDLSAQLSRREEDNTTMASRIPVMSSPPLSRAQVGTGGNGDDESGVASVRDVLNKAEAALAAISMQSQTRQSLSWRSRAEEDKELSDALGVRSFDRASGSSPDQTENGPPSSSRSRRHQTFLHQEEEEEEKQHGDQMSVSTASNSISLSSAVSESIEHASEWRPLNKLLTRNGYSSLTLQEVSMDSLDGKVLVPDPNKLFNLVAEFITQMDRKEHIIQDLVLDSTRSSKVQSRTEDNLLSSEKKNHNTKTLLLKANQEINRLKEEMRKLNATNELHTKKLQKAMLNLKQQLKVSEHRVKAKEVLVERMQQKLQQQVDKENVSKQRDRQVFRQFKQKEWSRNPRASGRKSTRDDVKPLECISVYEAQQARMEEELSHMRAQVQALNAEVRDKENYIARKEFGASWVDPTYNEQDDKMKHKPWKHGNNSDELVEHLESVRREQEANALRLKQREATMIKKVNAIEQELLHAREVIHELKEENANLVLEAESRPSIRDYRLAQRRIHQLEVQVSESKLALEEAKDINDLRKYMDTKDLMTQDRLNHRLRLNRLNTIPRETALEVIKGVCRELNLTDITLIGPSIQKLCAVVNAVPRMEKFIRDICGFVFFNRFHENAGENSTQEQLDVVVLEQVLPTLQKWLLDLKRLHALENFRVSVITELCKRTIEPNLLAIPGSTDSLKETKDPNLSRVLCSIAELVELEKNVFHQREIYKTAAAQLEREPNVLINQIVQHFSQLFQVKSIDGVLPKINEIYLFVNEMQNFMKVICDTLGLPKTTSVSNCLTALRDQLEPSEEKLRHQARSAALGVDSTNYVVDKTAQRPQDNLVGIREVREMSLLVRDLKRELGAATMQDILPRTKRLMELLSLSIRPEEDDV